jgi:hypothetical protein
MILAWFIGICVLILIIAALAVVYLWPFIILIIILIIAMFIADESKTTTQDTIRLKIDTTHTIGRNDPCPCGSGKKYKKCCGALNDSTK